MIDIERAALKRDEGIIAQHYGALHQALKLFEELDECKEAVRAYINGTDSKEHAIEEIADSEVMLDQIKILLDAWDKVNEIKREKVNRQLKRIEAENENR